MKSSNSVFYAILAVYMPFAALLAVLPFLFAAITGLLGAMDIFIELPLFFPLLCSLLASGAASVYYTLVRYSPVDHSGADLRGAVVAALASYGLASLCRFGVPLTARFLPSLAATPSFLTGFYAWFSTLSNRHCFEGREQFDVFRGRVIESGANYKEIMREETPLLLGMDRRLKYLLVSWIIPGALTALCVILCFALKAHVPAVYYVLLAIVFFSGLAIAGTLIFFRREHVLATDGLLLEDHDRSRTFAAALIFLIPPAALALLFSTGRSPLPLSTLLAIIDGFFYLLSRIFKSPEPSDPIPPELREMMQPNEMPLTNPLAGLGGDAEPWPYWDYVKWGAIALAVLAFLWFLIYPLVKRDRSAGGLPLAERIKRSLLAALARIRGAFRDFAASFFSGSRVSRMKKPSAERVARMAGDLLAGLSAEKRREIRRSVTLFARLILWGEDELRVPWKPSLTPAEYCALLAAALIVAETAAGAGEAAPGAGKASAVIRAGALFEKALYGGMPLTEEEHLEFRRTVESLVA